MSQHCPITLLLFKMTHGIQHEIDMTKPALSSIQAGIVACAVLGSSQDETAHKVIPLYFARIVSVSISSMEIGPSPTC